MKEAGVLFAIICLYWSVVYAYMRPWSTVNRAEVVTTLSLLLLQLQVRTRVLRSLYYQVLGIEKLPKCRKPRNHLCSWASLWGVSNTSWVRHKLKTSFNLSLTLFYVYHVVLVKHLHRTPPIWYSSVISVCWGNCCEEDRICWCYVVKLPVSVDRLRLTQRCSNTD